MSSSLPPPAEWGPKFWYTMMMVARAYGDAPTAEQRAQTRAWYLAFKEVLPCPECREHYVQVLRDMPIDTHLANSAALLAWVQRVQARVSSLITAKSDRVAVAPVQQPRAQAPQVATPFLRQMKSIGLARPQVHARTPQVAPKVAPTVTRASVPRKTAPTSNQIRSRALVRRRIVRPANAPRVTNAAAARATARQMPKRPCGCGKR